MADIVYPKAREGFLSGQLSWTGTLRVVLLDTTQYTVTPLTDQFLSDIPEAARVGISDPLTGLSYTLGVADADDVEFDEVSGEPVRAFAIYKDSGDEESSRLILYIDSYTNFPFTPSGGPLSIRWPAGGIFILGEA